MSRPDDLERELKRELHRLLDPISAAPIPPRRALASGGIARRVAGGAGAALGLKVLTGFAVAAFAAAAAGAATEVAVTHSLNPADWGQQVHQTVQACKNDLRASGTRGIGACVSAFASQHGQTAGDSTKSTQNNGKAGAKDKDNANGNGNGNGKKKSEPRNPGGKDHPGPPPVPAK